MRASVRKQIDAHLAEVVRQTQELEQFLWAASAAALEHGSIDGIALVALSESAMADLGIKKLGHLR